MFDNFTRTEIKTSGARIVTVHGGKGAYLPLAVGNTWRYRCSDAAGGWETTSVFRVASSAGDRRMLTHYALSRRAPAEPGA